MSEHKASAASTEGIVTSNKMARSWPHISLPILAVAFVVLVLAITTGILYQAHRDHQAHQAALTKASAALGSDYTVLSKQQIDTKLQALGLSLDKVQNSPVSKATYKNFDQAYAAAQALYVLDNIPKSVQAYALAETLGPSKTDYKFYASYAASAQFDNDPSLWQKELANEKRAAQMDGSLSATQKQAISNRIDRLIKEVNL